MRRDILEVDNTVSARTTLPVSLQDVESVRLLLTGESVVDWQRLSFRDLADVDRFLATHLLDTSDAEDIERVRYVFNEAVSYLEEQLHLKFPAELRNPSDIRLVFLWASQWGGFRRTQILSCVVLKLMHIIHHMEAADLRFRLPLAEEQILASAHRRILAQVYEMQDAGVPITAFYGSRKSRSSVITKLIAKREAVAATIFDKLRFRLVVRRYRDLVPTIAYLARELFPFNYVVPGQSHDNLLEASLVPNRLLDWLTPEDRAVALQRTEPGLGDVPVGLIDGRTESGTPRNEFSGASYRAINFIVNYPVRVPPSVEERFSFELGRVVYVNVEFQVLDEATSKTNELGENAHALYKARQHRRVAARLKRGAAARNE
ncbi:MAG: TIGR04552 family protein [Myxococcota bacterium]